MSNLTATTREMWDRTVYDQVWMRHVLLHLLIKRKQVLKAGTAIKHTVDYAEMDSLVQEYAPNDTMDGGSKTLAETAVWYPKFAQLPVEITAKDMLANRGGGDGRIISLQEYLVRKAQRGMRIFLNTVTYRAGSVTRDAENAEGIQGLNDALTHDIQYGGLARLIATPTRTFWQGASLGDIWTDQGTAMTPSISNFRACLDKVNAFSDSPNDVVCICSNANFRELQSQVESQRTYTAKGLHADYGFTSMMIDDVEVFAEPWLSNSANANASTTTKYFYMLHLPDWTLHVDAERGLGNMTDFFHQADIQGGQDLYLARLMLRGTFVCTQPNASIFKSNVAI